MKCEKCLEYSKRIKKLKTHCKEMISDFSKQERSDPSNFMASFGIHVYEEVLEIIKEGK